MSGEPHTWNALTLAQITEDWLYHFDLFGKWNARTKEWGPKRRRKRGASDNDRQLLDEAYLEDTIKTIDSYLDSLALLAAHCGIDSTPIVEYIISGMDPKYVRALRILLLRLHYQEVILFAENLTDDAKPPYFVRLLEKRQKRTADLVDPVADARDEWIYKRAMDNIPWDAIRLQLREIAPSRKWRIIGTGRGIQDRAFAFAKRKKLPAPAARQERGT